MRDGSPPQTNIVHVDGKRSVLMSVLKNGSVSTLGIIAGIKQHVLEAKGVIARQAADRRRSATSRCSCARPSAAWRAKA